MDKKQARWQLTKYILISLLIVIVLVVVMKFILPYTIGYVDETYAVILLAVPIICTGVILYHINQLKNQLKK